MEDINNLKEKYRGAMLGLAAGDALGTTLEFARRGDFTPITDMVGGGPFRLQAGQWTDDTSMALCLGQSLVMKGFDTFDQMDRYLNWYRNGYMSSVPGVCVDIGLTTRDSLIKYERSGQAISGPKDRMSAGNGSIMRLAPLALYFRSSQGLQDKASVSSATTHGAPQSKDGCRILASLIEMALNGAAKEEILADHRERFPDADPDFKGVLAGNYKTKSEDSISASGYVVHTLDAALWAFYHTDNFRAGALMAVNLGNDADTTGAVYGQLAGAFYGENSIPQTWREKLALKELIRGMADDLLKANLALSAGR